MAYQDHSKKRFTWPDLVIIEFLTAVMLTNILIVWALLVNAPLLEIANPSISENPAKAPWYFVGLQELLVYFDPWIAGVVIPCIIIGALIIIPYLDNNQQGSGRYSFRVRKFAVINFMIGFSMWWILILIGYFLRGPDWRLYLPWSEDPIMDISEEVLWSPEPYIGAIGIFLYFGAGMFVPGLISREFYIKCGRWRYIIVTMLMLLMYAVPVKILLRLIFRIKYVLVTPWFNI